MPDDLDRAAEISAQHTADAIARARRQVAAAVGPAICIDCDEPIPEARRLAFPGADRCISCKTLMERAR